MDITEVSLTFDALWNNINSNMAPGLSPYEKSLFLTQAKEQIVRELYEGNGLTTPGFESTESAMEALQPLVRHFTYFADKPTEDTLTIQSRVFIPLTGGDNEPPKIMYIVYEEVSGCSGNCDNKTLLVTPVAHNDFYNVNQNPFKGPKSNNRALRLLSKDAIELILPEGLSFGGYTMRYLTYPQPIILSGCPTTLKINGIPCSQVTTDLELPEFLHRPIIMRAVAIAKAAWNS